MLALVALFTLLLSTRTVIIVLARWDRLLCLVRRDVLVSRLRMA